MCHFSIEKLIEHKWDIEQDLLFGTQFIDETNNVNYTQGAVDYIAGAGNIFTLNHDTKSQDDFLDDMSQFLDPRYNNGGATVYFCNTEVYNWLHKLGGYFKANLDKDDQYRADLAVTGKKMAAGVDVTTISTSLYDF